MFALQISDTTLYLVCGIVVYAYVGENATSPALGNTGVTLRKIAFGIALPTIMIAGVINGHVCAKMVSHQVLSTIYHVLISNHVDLRKNASNINMFVGFNS